MTPAEFASSAGLTPADEMPDLSFWPVAELGQGQKATFGQGPPVIRSSIVQFSGTIVFK
ncbi:hypothetical protein [Sphingobium sp. LSP13-1-1.1]|uniref:hypothetical protein n=1 Tax=Sphingobium sp. LSP13-1-1.1 TaxID=3135234 RepID=UPI0034374CF4